MSLFCMSIFKKKNNKNNYNNQSMHCNIRFLNHQIQVMKTYIDQDLLRYE